MLPLEWMLRNNRKHKHPMHYFWKKDSNDGDDNESNARIKQCTEPIFFVLQSWIGSSRAAGKIGYFQFFSLNGNKLNERAERGREREWERRTEIVRFTNIKAHTNPSIYCVFAFIMRSISLFEYIICTYVDSIACDLYNMTGSLTLKCHISVCNAAQYASANIIHGPVCSSVCVCVLYIFECMWYWTL